MNYENGHYQVLDAKGNYVGRIDQDEFVRNGKSLLYRIDGDEFYSLNGLLIGVIENGKVYEPKSYEALFQICPE
jgi:hypothetical protein